MKKTNIPDRVLEKTLPAASEAVDESTRHGLSEQTRSPTYKIAFADDDFLLRDEMRGARLELEFQKAELCQQEKGIESTLVIFGSAQIIEESVARSYLVEAEAALAKSPTDLNLQTALE